MKMCVCVIVVHTTLSVTSASPLHRSIYKRSSDWSITGNKGTRTCLELLSRATKTNGERDERANKIGYSAHTLFFLNFTPCRQFCIRDKKPVKSDIEQIQKISVYCYTSEREHVI